MRTRALLLVPWIVAVAACSSASVSAPSDAGADAARDASREASHPDADGSARRDASSRNDGADDARKEDVIDASIDKTAPCVSTFGTAIGSVGFARFDGTVVAVLPPGNTTCTAPNHTHLVLELMFAGAVYRMVVDVDDLASPGTIHTRTLSRALVGGPWSDGWHTVPLDYVSTLGVHKSSFVSTPTADAVTAVTAALDLGAHVSVFATAQGEVDSSHLIHRNLPSQDGAIVVDVDGSPKWLLFSFSDQTF